MIASNTWGSWTASSLDSPTPLVFCGKELTTIPRDRKNDMPAHIKLTQQALMQDTESRIITSHGRQDPRLPSSEVTEYRRSMVGCLQWAAWIITSGFGGWCQSLAEWNAKSGALAWAV
eukprot:6097404-Amphidinium_carterae.2